MYARHDYILAGRGGQGRAGRAGLEYWGAVLWCGDLLTHGNSGCLPTTPAPFFFFFFFLFFNSYFLPFNDGRVANLDLAYSVLSCWLRGTWGEWYSFVLVWIGLFLCFFHCWSVYVRLAWGFLLFFYYIHVHFHFILC